MFSITPFVCILGEVNISYIFCFIFRDLLTFKEFYFTKLFLYFSWGWLGRFCLSSKIIRNFRLEYSTDWSRWRAISKSQYSLVSFVASRFSTWLEVFNWTSKRCFVGIWWSGKVHIFWEGHKSLRNLHRRFDWHYIGQIYDGDFTKFCGLLRIYEL